MHSGRMWSGREHMHSGRMRAEHMPSGRMWAWVHVFRAHVVWALVGTGTCILGTCGPGACGRGCMRCERMRSGRGRMCSGCFIMLCANEEVGRPTSLFHRIIRSCDKYAPRPLCALRLVIDAVMNKTVC